MAGESCPESALLPELLAGTLSSGQQERLTKHLDTCVSCQRSLETLAAADKPLPRIPPDVSDPGAQPRLQQVMKDLEQGPSPPEDADESPSGKGANLDFLAPSERPDSLGRLDHYEVLEVISRGGMGVVLKALDVKLHRVVAVKVMAPQLAANATARLRFLREARATAAVRDDHVISIHAVEEANGLPYLVMEFIDGVSLQQRLDRTGPLALERIVRIGMQVASGLAAAHAHGLVHRDIKPGNILLENSVERVKITDFGLARVADDASLTQSGVIAGTPQYMAPEQGRGEPADHRADLFSLGSVLYAMCVGHPPFRASGALAVLKRVCEDTPRPVQQVNPDIPAWLGAIIEKLHAKAPGDRFQSAAEVAELLGRHLAHLQDPTRAPQPSPIVAARAPRRRRLALAALALVALIGGLGLTETTGLTRALPTVIRLVTGEGTLVVEVDDDSIEVIVESDGTLAFRGAGPREVRLRPGTYQVLASSAGKQVPVDQPLITIARGGKQVVRVRRESPRVATPGEQQKPAAAKSKEPPAEATVKDARKSPLQVRLLSDLVATDAVLKANPDDLPALFKRADLLRKLERFDAAVETFTEVIAKASNEAWRIRGLSHRANTHAERGDVQAAIDDYEQYFRILPPRNAWPYGRVAVLYLFGPEKVRDPDRALDHAEKAAQQTDAHPGYMTLWGVALYRAGKHREAVEALEQAYQHKAKEGRTTLNRFFAALSYHQLGEIAKAQACYAQGTKLPPMGPQFGSPSDLGEMARAEADALLKLRPSSSK